MSDMDANPAGPPFLVARLSALIFGAFAILGAWVPIFALHLTQLGFSPDATAWASGSNAIAALTAPLIWGQIADRWIAMQRCISLCAAASGAALLVLAELSEPWAVFFVCLLMWCFLIPTVGLTSSLIFRQLEHPEREYGKIRMWGTVGWVGASWCLTLWFLLCEGNAGGGRDLADGLRLGGLAGLALALYAWTLPHTPPIADALEADDVERAWLARIASAPAAALRLFHDRSFVIFCVCLFGLNITLAFSIQLNPLLFARLGVQRDRLPVCLTVAQSTEVLFLYLLPFLLMRFGAKPIMVAGGISWTLGMSLLAIDSPLWLAITSLATHGVFICCFFIAGHVFVNRLATHDIRASAQGLLLLISGSGLLLGHVLVGWIRAWTNDEYPVAYACAAALAGGLTLLFSLCFTGKVKEPLVPGAEMT
jgi:MFS family permease